MSRKILYILLLVNIALLISSCYPTKSLQEDEYLFIGNEYVIEQGSFKGNDISYYYKHKSNSKALGIRAYLIWHNILYRFKDSTQRDSIKGGEKPVIYDSLRIAVSVTNIETYLQNEGYFNARVESEIKEGKLLRKKKTKKAVFHIYLGDAYTIQNLHLDIKDPPVRAFVQVDLPKSDIKKGNRFSVSNLKKERKRITENMQNKGYYYFKEDLITFDVDTNFAGSVLDLTFKVGQYKIRDQKTDSIISIPNRRFKVRNIYVYSDISATDIGPETDTLVFKTVEYKDTTIYHFLYNEPLVISPRALARAIYIEQGVYKKSDATETYKQLSNLNNFKIINIGFQDVSKSLTGYGELDCIIELHRYPRFFVNTEFGAKHTGGDLGIELSEAIGHKNLFGNAEIASLQAHGAIEMQRNTQDTTQPLSFNTWEAGLNMKVDVPRFLFPFGKYMLPRYFNPTTSFNFGYNVQNRTDFKRNILNGSFMYAWKPRKSQRHVIPINLSAVSIDPTESFQEVIDGFSDPRVRYAYQNHLVSGIAYSFTHNTQQMRSAKPFYFFSSKAEVGGLLFHSIRNILQQNDDGLYLIGNLPYSNYARIQTDFRAYLPTGMNVMNVLRVYVGAGFSGLNSKTLPFEKSFYAGGSNNLRGWILGTAGPGGFSDNTAFFEKTGDIKIEFNYELRFPIIPELEIGLFADAGNIWLQKNNTDFPEGNIEWDFYKEFNINVGYGVRYDLDFLILRLDMAHPIYQPYLAEGDRWSIKNQSYARGFIADMFSGSKHSLFQNLSPYVPVFNFAIGYPF